MMNRIASGVAAYIRLIFIGAKSRFKSLAGMAVSALAVPLILAAVLSAFAPVVSGAFTQNKLRLVFCDLEGSSFFDTLINLLLSDESITKTAVVRKMGYDESISSLRAGDADAVVVFPETFISDMSRGINQPVTIIGNEADPVKTVFIKEFIKSAADELSAAQSAINTVWFHMDLENMSDFSRSISFTAITLEYTSKAFARSAYYAFENVNPPYEGASAAAFIISSALAALIFFGSLSGIKQIIAERRLGITVRLASAGISGARAALYHFVPIYFKQLLCAFFAALIALPAVAYTAASYKPDISADYAGGAASASAYEQSGPGAGTAADSIIGGVINQTIGPGRNKPATGADAAASGAGADASGAGMDASGAGAGADAGAGSSGAGMDAQGAGAGAGAGADASGAGADASGTGADASGAGMDASRAGAGASGASANTAGADASGAGSNDAASDDNGYGGAGSGATGADAPGDGAIDILSASSLKDYADRLVRVFPILCVLCLFTASLSLFLGYMLKRAESAEVLIVTLGAAMATAGGTLIPYTFMPGFMQTLGPFCFNKWAQSLIASALFDDTRTTAMAAASPGNISVLTVFTILAVMFTAASVWKARRSSI